MKFLTATVLAAALALVGLGCEQGAGPGGGTEPAPESPPTTPAPGEQSPDTPSTPDSPPDQGAPEPGSDPLGAN